MADAHASGACIRTGVRVQIPFSASKKQSRIRMSDARLLFLCLRQFLPNLSKRVYLSPKVILIKNGATNVDKIITITSAL